MQANPYAFLAKKAQPRLEFPGTVENKKLREKNVVQHDVQIDCNPDYVK